MNYRKTIAILTLGLAVTGLAVQGPAGAADDTKGAKIKAAIKKAIDAKKKDDPKKKDDKKTEAKPIPAIIDPPNAPAHPMPTASLAQLIDDGIRERLATEKVQPSAAATDAEFVRRTFLDITGVIPTADRAAAFLDDRSADKRTKLIDELLESKNFGKRQADIWTALMYPVDSDNRFVGKAPLREWLTDQFNDNVHWDRLAFDLITATGEQEKNGATTYAMANRGVDKMTDSLGKLFLGVQIQCAQCHNHPFTHWKQTEYWGLAQFFYKVDVSNPRLAKDGGAITVSESNRPNRRANPLPESSKSVPAQLLGGDVLKLDASKPYRPVLAQWVAAPANPFFAKAFVNRLWSQYFGRGFVNPVDDLSDENEPTHPDLSDIRIAVEA